MADELARARVMAHIDLDAFYAAVEVKRQPELRGKPLVVVQYNPFGDLRDVRPDDPARLMPNSNGSVIAVSYEARAHGVKRNMMGKEARRLCPDLNIIQVPVAHGKADLTPYREAGAQVVAVLSRLSLCERASIDEVYLDVTEEAQKRLEALPPGGGSAAPSPPSWAGLHVIGVAASGEDDAGERSAQVWWARPPDAWGQHEPLLAAGAAVVAELRAAVAAELGFSCSAGVSHWKLLAKLGSGMHKPGQQTVVPASAVAGLLRDLPLTRLRGLGGEFGQQVQRALGVTTCGEVWDVPVARLETLFGKRGPWLARLVWGVDTDNDIKHRLVAKQISCGKTFRGAHGLTEMRAVAHWLGELAKEVAERCVADRQDNKRIPTTLTVSVTNEPPGDAQGTSNFTRSGPLGQTNAAALAQAAAALVKKWAAERPGWRITSMSIGASGFVAAPTGGSTITRFLGGGERAAAGPSASLTPPQGQRTSWARQPADAGHPSPSTSPWWEHSGSGRVSASASASASPLVAPLRSAGWSSGEGESGCDSDASPAVGDGTEAQPPNVGHQPEQSQPPGESQQLPASLADWLSQGGGAEPCGSTAGVGQVEKVPVPALKPSSASHRTRRQLEGWLGSGGADGGQSPPAKRVHTSVGAAGLQGVDPGVLAELPPAIQQEVLDSLAPGRPQVSPARPGPQRSIKSFFAAPGRKP